MKQFKNMNEQTVTESSRVQKSVSENIKSTKRNANSTDSVRISTKLSSFRSKGFTQVAYINMKNWRNRNRTKLDISLKKVGVTIMNAMHTFLTKTTTEWYLDNSWFGFRYLKSSKFEKVLNMNFHTSVSWIYVFNFFLFENPW